MSKIRLEGVELISAGARTVRAHLRPLAVGFSQIGIGLAKLCAGTVLSLGKRIASVARAAFRQVASRSAQICRWVVGVVTEVLATCARLATNVRGELLRLIQNKWVWICAALAPAVAWVVVSAFGFMSDTDRVREFIAHHPRVSWIVIGSILLAEITVIGTAAFHYIRRACENLRRVLVWTAKRAVAWYLGLPLGLQRALQKIPSIAARVVLALQIGAMASLCWLFFSSLNANEKLWLGLGLLGVGVLCGISWLLWRVFGKRASAVVFSFLRLCNGLREHFGVLVAGARAKASQLREIVLRGVAIWARSFAMRIRVLLAAATGTRLELALVKHRGAETSGSKFGFSLVDFSILGFALISITFLSFAGMEFSGISLEFGRGHAEKSETSAPRAAHSAPSMLAGLAAAWDNASSFVSTLVDNVAETASNLFNGQPPQLIQTYNGMAISEYVWAVGSTTNFVSRPSAAFGRFGLGPLCRFDIVVAFGTASSDGGDGLNARLSNQRARELARLVNEQRAACGERDAPAIIAVSLGEGRSSDANPDQRRLLVVGLENVRGADPRTVTMENLRLVLSRDPSIGPQLAGYRGFAPCVAVPNRRLGQIEACEAA